MLRATQLLGEFPKQVKIGFQTEAVKGKFIEALIMITEKWKQFKSKPTDARLNKRGISTQWTHSDYIGGHKRGAKYWCKLQHVKP